MSRFNNLFNKAAEQPKPEPKSASKTKKTVAKKQAEQPAEAAEPPQPATDTQPSTRGRKKSGSAKSSSPGWSQITLYLEEANYTALKIAALQDKEDSSDIVNRLVADWLAARNGVQ